MTNDQLIEAAKAAGATFEPAPVVERKSQRYSFVGGFWVLPDGASIQVGYTRFQASRTRQEPVLVVRFPGTHIAANYGQFINRYFPQ